MRRSDVTNASSLSIVNFQLLVDESLNEAKTLQWFYVIPGQNTIRSNLYLDQTGRDEEASSSTEHTDAVIIPVDEKCWTGLGHWSLSRNLLVCGEIVHVRPELTEV